MNSENSKTSDACRLRLDLMDKVDLQRGDNKVALWDLSIYYTWSNIKFKSNKFEISWTTWDLEFGSHSTSDCLSTSIIIEHETLTDKQSILTYINKIQNQITSWALSWALDTWDYGIIWESRKKIKSNQKQKWWECGTSRKY